MADNYGFGQLWRTARHSAIYAFGSILRRITGLVMLPIYTRYLTPADYGVVELLTMAIDLASILVGVRISQAMFRYYILAESEQEKRRTVSTVLFLVVMSSGIGATLLFISAEQLSILIFGSVEYLFEFQVFALTLITTVVSAVGMSYIRAKRKPILFVTIGAVTLALQVTLNIIFVVVMEMHVTGVVISALVSGVLVSVGLIVYMVSSTGIHFSMSWLES